VCAERKTSNFPRMTDSSGSNSNRFNNGVPILAAGSILQERYRIARELGSGGMGAVYEAIDQRLDATVAIKETFSVDQRLRRQFEQEARLLARLHHSALPRVSDYFVEDGRAFIVMQFVAGEDLAQTIAQRARPFPTSQVIAWADQLLDVLIYLHSRERQIIHRDIKPHNLKLTESGELALLDFGLAKADAGDHSQTQSSSSLFGYTKRYSPLEQIQDQGTSPQSDIYALGATLYHLLTGVKPADALARAAEVANQKPDPLRTANEVNEAVASDLAGILNKALALNAVDRFQSAGEFREALRRLGRKAFENDSEPNNGSRKNEPAPLGNGGAKPARRTDPFDSYTILKPEEALFQTPKPKRTPALVLSAVAIILVLLVISYPSGLFSSLAGFLFSSQGGVSRDEAAATVIRQRRREPASPKPSPAEVDAAGDVSHKSEPAKRRPRRNPQKSVELKPPPFSIAP
jgi:serine/threonine protein kinase